ncbi:MAG TPA: hypothetical protein VMT30_09400 [Candidatus Saccharimonadia bacterium]|nr:hypothetical protein [Candidatus Saccharimonadia bacterium]
MQNVSGSAPLCPDPFPTDSRYTQIPNGVHELVENARELQLVVHLLSFRWYPSSPIIPSVKTLAKAMKCSARTVRRTAERIESRGLLQRQERLAWDKRQMSNEYILCGALLALVTAVEASRDQEARPEWQGRRSNAAGKENSRNQTNRTRRNERRYTPPSTGGDFLMTRYGPLKPRT